jgi:hypothetical protein
MPIKEQNVNYSQIMIKKKPRSKIIILQNTDFDFIYNSDRLLASSRG